MTPEEYKVAALRTEFMPDIVHRDGAVDHALGRLLHGVIGACTEVGELQDQVKKHWIYGKTLDRTNILEEIGDICWYLNIALDAYGLSWSDCFERNIAKLSKRYPDKFSSDAALNRDLANERAALETRGK